MIEEAATPEELRSNEDRISTEVCDPSIRFSPLNWAAPTTESTCPFSASMSVWILVRSTLLPCAATILPLICVRRSVTVSAA
ncbi:MAG: hypothetical protein ACD_54C00459G0005 [uncultured bacterium]|nr:MAG: hypothetical protein ACD_54C00459G0005 [uncultured bacterium]